MGVCCGILELGDVTTALLHCNQLNAGQCEKSRGKCATAADYETLKTMAIALKIRFKSGSINCQKGQKGHFFCTLSIIYKCI